MIPIHLVDTARLSRYLTPAVSGTGPGADGVNQSVCRNVEFQRGGGGHPDTGIRTVDHLTVGDALKGHAVEDREYAPGRCDRVGTLEDIRRHTVSDDFNEHRMPLEVQTFGYGL